MNDKIFHIDYETDDIEEAIGEYMKEKYPGVKEVIAKAKVKEK